MDNQLQTLIQLQTEQNELLKRHLVRLKFSLMSLLLLTTATCCGLGFLVWGRYHPMIYPVPATSPWTSYVPPGYGNIQPAPVAPTTPSDPQTYFSPKPPAQAPISDRYGQ